MNKTAAIIALFGVAASSSYGILDIIDYDPELHNRFETWNYASPTVNQSPNFIGQGHDLSGWGWDSGGRGVTLITSRHIVMANHWHPDVGRTIYFSDANGNVTSRVIESKVHIGGDVMMGVLDTDITADTGITPVKTPAGDNPLQVGDKLLVGGRYGYVGTNEIEALSSAVIYYRDTTAGSAMPAMYDSSSPVFAYQGGSIVFAGFHTSVSNIPEARIAYDTNISFYLPSISGEVAGQGYSLDPIPEPSQTVAALAGVALLAAFVCRRRHTTFNR